MDETFNLSSFLYIHVPVLCAMCAHIQSQKEPVSTGEVFLLDKIDEGSEHVDLRPGGRRDNIVR